SIYPSLTACVPHTAPLGLAALSLHDALPISYACSDFLFAVSASSAASCARSRESCMSLIVLLHCFTRCSHLLSGGDYDGWQAPRSEEHTSELQSRFDLVCRLLLEKKNSTNRH